MIDHIHIDNLHNFIEKKFWRLKFLLEAIFKVNLKDICEERVKKSMD